MLVNTITVTTGSDGYASFSIRANDYQNAIDNPPPWTQSPGTMPINIEVTDFESDKETKTLTVSVFDGFF